MNAAWRVVTPRGSSGAIAIIQIEGDGVDDALRQLGLGDVGVGRVLLRDLLGVDRGVVMRPSESCVQLMAHGGKAVVDAIVAKLIAGGICEAPSACDESALSAMYPEAGSLLEARMLAALARAHSPRAIDLLLDQPARWQRSGARSDPVLDAMRNRLIDPPLVAAMGPANIGKSTLLNALAGRTVAVVSDEPGTTRDHVGVMLDLDGLTVRYVDTPGVRDGGGESERMARELARRVVDEADLVLACGDGGARPLETHGDSLVVALRCDLGGAGFESDARVSALAGEGLDELAEVVRRRLVSDRAIEDVSPWKFWEDGPSESGRA